MANEPDPNAVQQVVDKQTAEIDGVPLPVAAGPREEIYRLDPASKVLVSKKEGTVWKGRKDAGIAQMRDVVEGWEEAERYYSNVQQNHRQETAGNKSGTRAYAKNRRDSFSMTENIVYATVNAVIPNTYAKNPNVEVTMLDESADDVGTALEHLLNRLASMESAPGINLKPKMKKSVVRCELTNEAWMMIGWVKREDSADAALEDIKRIGAKLADENTDAKDIIELEGQLMALEETIDLLDPPGPFIRAFQGNCVLVDLDSCEDTGDDANWMMVSTMMSTAYLNARYRQKTAEGQYASAYQASHVVDAVKTQDVASLQQQIDTFKIFDVNNDNYKDYGYDSKTAYERAKRTKVWYVFDKVKRRFMLYADNDWTWPIWVFDDPYHLPRFFPVRRMQYHTDPSAIRSRGEVSNYLDQQDEINTIVDELNRARTSLRDNALYNSASMDQKTAEDVLLNSNKKVKGIRVPDGQKIADMISGPPMPTLQYEHLWDKSQAKAAVTMISGLGEAMRGEQYKTNTTNQAIEQYNSISGMRLDEKRDAIEDFVAGIMSDVMFLVLQFMDAETMASLVGPKYAPALQGLANMEPSMIRSKVLCSIEGGSTQKPTSAAKKAEALQMGQILGQFASASPLILLVLLKIFERSFDGIVMTADDWKQLEAGIMQQLQGQQQQGAGEQGQGGPDPQKVDAAVQELVKQGMPEQEAKQRVQQRLQQTQH